jgi:hypothetical protein
VEVGAKLTHAPSQLSARHDLTVCIRTA